MRALIRTLIRSLVLVLCVTASAWAADTPSSKSTAAETLCKQTKLTDAKYFPSARESALKVRHVLCFEGGNQDAILNALVDFVEKQRGEHWFDRFGGFENNGDPLARVLELLNANRDQIPTIGLTASDDLEVAGKPFLVASRSKCDSAAKNGEQCGNVLDEFREYYAYAHATFAAKPALEFSNAVRVLEKDWDRYLNDTRSQTPLELLINSAVFKRKETLQFSAAPDMQWIVLHPSIVVENVQAAVDGENTKAAFMIELAGANWWRQEKWYVPTGGSIIAVYTDRPGVQDMGYGVALNFRSVYSIGYAVHDGEGGVFVSFDLLKLLQDEKKTLEMFIK
jgi:hypothetical protein